MTKPKRPPSVRQQLLENAVSLTCGDRNRAYGEPFENMLNTAALLQAYLEGVAGDHTRQLSAKDAACIMVLVKLARTFGTPYSSDTYTDMAAYAAIAGECAAVEAHT